MVVVSPKLLEKHMSSNRLVERAIKVLEGDDEVRWLLRMANTMAVSRLGYNDHGPVHARIVAGTALELFDILTRRGVRPTSIRDGTAENLDEARVIVAIAAYLHDIGNAVHRSMHELIGAMLAKDILDRLLPKILGPGPRIYGIRQEILHAICSTQYDLRCLTVEAGMVKISDGLDMSEGRARIPYKLGKIDMHSVSAISIKYVNVEEGEERPLRVVVEMEDLAGLFQIEEVLLPKVQTSGLEDKIEIVVYSRGKRLITYPR